MQRWFVYVFVLLIFMEFILKTRCEEELDVLILGAGLSGIGAALELYKSNVTNFLVLEAKDYIGGRVKSETFYNKTISMGAGWIHNTQYLHEIYLLARKHRLKYAKDNYDLKHMSIRHGGYGFPFKRWYISWTQRSIDRALERCRALIDEETEESMTISLRQCLDKGGWNRRGTMREAIDWLMFDFENGATAEKTSAWQSTYTGIGIDVLVNDPRGYIFPVLQEINPFKDKFILNTPVKSVKKTNDGYIVVTNKRNYKAKHVIVSFSSGVLLAGKVKFSPNLPSWKREALQYVPMGHYCRYFFKFPYQFWENATFIILANKPRGHYIHWQNLNQPHFYPGSNILLATLTGETCKEKEKVDDKTIIKEAMKMIRIQKDYKNAPDPLELRRSNWSSDPYTLGAYGCMKPGIAPHHYRALEHPCWRTLWFTGEYANEEMPGYTNGALQHGRSIGEKVVKYLLHNLRPSLEP